MRSSICFLLFSLLVRLNTAHERHKTIATDDALQDSYKNNTEDVSKGNLKETDNISVMRHEKETLKSQNGHRLVVKDSIFQDRGLKLKYKKAELQFFMKAFMALKIVLGIILPLGIILAKVLSWKAVTLSLMSFMLAKILFVKNLLTNKNTFSGSSANFIPPVLIQSAPNDLFWKRQGDLNTAYSWSSS